MAYITYLRRWRAKYTLAISISLNAILFLLILKGHFLSSKSYDNQDKALSKFRRERYSEDKRLSCFIFALVLTAPDSQERRNAIRKTWLKLPIPKRFSFIHRFFVGTEQLRQEQRNKLVLEQEENGDLVFLADFKDSYHNLTLKVLNSFEWINRNVDAKFILKVDDDSFVRLGNLATDLEKKEKYGRIYWGFFRGDANVKKAGPWKEPNWVLCDKYLPYADGGGYVLSKDLVDHISRQKDMLQLYNSEDVSVGTWLAPVRLNRVHDVRFDTEYKSRGCNNQHIVSHKQTIQDMFNKYEQLTRYGRLCAQESVERFSFEYDWTAKPSQCCKRIPGIP